MNEKIGNELIVEGVSSVNETRKTLIRENLAKFHYSQEEYVNQDQKTAEMTYVATQKISDENNDSVNLLKVVDRTGN